MANKITYANKVGIEPKGVHINQWWDDDANEIKEKHNLNDDRITGLEAVDGVVEEGNVDAVKGGDIHTYFGYIGLISFSRASISIVNNVITLGDGTIYTLFRDGVLKPIAHTSQDYTMSSGDILVHNKTTNLISKKNNTTILKDDAILFSYDGAVGVTAGLLYEQYLKGSISETDTKVNNQPTYAMARASISIVGNVVTLGTGTIYIGLDDGTEKSVAHSSTTYTLASHQSVVYNITSNSITTKTVAEILSDDVILFTYDGVVGVVDGALMTQHLTLSVNDISISVPTYAISRATITVLDDTVTLGDGTIWVGYSDGVEKTIIQTETTYTLGSHQSLVYSRVSQLVSVKSVSDLILGDAILFIYDGLVGTVDGLLMNQYINDKIAEINVSLASENRPSDSVRGIHHRGYSFIAPENTIAAYRASADVKNFVVECDIKWSSDDVPVLLHDDTIDRTSDGTGNVADLTIAQLKTYDFGSWKSSEYTGEQIPTFEEFLRYCKKMNLFAYAELKTNETSARVQIIVDLIEKTGMKGKIQLDSFNVATLSLVNGIDDSQDLGYLCSVLSSAEIATAVTVKTANNNVSIEADKTYITEVLVDEARTNGLGVVAWTVDDEADVLLMADLGIDGIITNQLNVNQVIRDGNI